MFVKMYDNFIRLTKERVNLWADKDQRRATGWYDPLGSFYEEISSDGKKSAMGQFFTPEHIVTMMTQISMGADADHKIERGEMVTLAEPACGSGRFILAANAMHPGTFSCGNDLDVMCAKMTRVEYVLEWRGGAGDVRGRSGHHRRIIQIWVGSGTNDGWYAGRSSATTPESRRFLTPISRYCRLWYPLFRSHTAWFHWKKRSV
jgi:hypothetical protein